MVHKYFIPYKDVLHMIPKYINTGIDVQKKQNNNNNNKTNQPTNQTKICELFTLLLEHKYKAAIKVLNTFNWSSTSGWPWGCQLYNNKQQTVSDLT